MQIWLGPISLIIDTLLVDIDALRADMLILKDQICVYLQIRVLALLPRQVLDAHHDKTTKLKAHIKELVNE